MEKVTKEQFIYILKILKDDGFIDDFLNYNMALSSDNAITITYIDNHATYYFDSDNKLINPEMQEVRKHIEELKRELKKFQEIEDSLIAEEEENNIF